MHHLYTAREGDAAQPLRVIALAEVQDTAVATGRVTLGSSASPNNEGSTTFSPDDHSDRSRQGSVTGPVRMIAVPR